MLEAKVVPSLNRFTVLWRGTPGWLILKSILSVGPIWGKALGGAPALSSEVILCSWGLPSRCVLIGVSHYDGVRRCLLLVQDRAFTVHMMHTTPSELLPKVVFSWRVERAACNEMTWFRNNDQGSSKGMLTVVEGYHGSGLRTSQKGKLSCRVGTIRP